MTVHNVFSCCATSFSWPPHSSSQGSGSLGDISRHQVSPEVAPVCCPSFRQKSAISQHVPDAAAKNGTRSRSKARVNEDLHAAHEEGCQRGLVGCGSLTTYTVSMRLICSSSPSSRACLDAKQASRIQQQHRPASNTYESSPPVNHVLLVAEYGPIEYFH